MILGGRPRRDPATAATKLHGPQSGRHARQHEARGGLQLTQNSVLAALHWLPLPLRR
jgi:hypothetical protein